MDVTGSGDEPKVIRARGFEDLVHGFTTRLGGVSEGGYASLNLGSSVGDDPALVARNHEIAAAAGKFSLPDLSTPSKQVHGHRTQSVTAQAMEAGECDAVATSSPGVVVGIRIADCVPLLLWDPKANAVAAVHAGWRGVAARIPTLAVEALVDRHGAAVKKIRAAIGPAIGPCCYEVGADVARKISEVAEFTPRFQLAPSGGAVGELKTRVDLRATVHLLLLDAGLDPANVDTVGGCTSCEAKIFFSHRRDRGVTGRHLAFIGARGTRR